MVTFLFPNPRMPWPEIKNLSTTDREFMCEKAKQAKQRAIDQYNEEQELLKR